MDRDFINKRGGGGRGGGGRGFGRGGNQNYRGGGGSGGGARPEEVASTSQLGIMHFMSIVMVDRDNAEAIHDAITEDRDAILGGLGDKATSGVCAPCVDILRQHVEKDFDRFRGHALFFGRNARRCLPLDSFTFFLSQLYLSGAACAELFDAPFLESVHVYLGAFLESSTHKNGPAGEAAATLQAEVTSGLDKARSDAAAHVAARRQHMNQTARHNGANEVPYAQLQTDWTRHKVLTDITDMPTAGSFLLAHQGDAAALVRANQGLPVVQVSEPVPAHLGWMHLLTLFQLARAECGSGLRKSMALIWQAAREASVAAAATAQNGGGGLTMAETEERVKKIVYKRGNENRDLRVRPYYHVRCVGVSFDVQAGLCYTMQLSQSLHSDRRLLFGNLIALSPAFFDPHTPIFVGVVRNVPDVSRSTSGYITATATNTNTNTKSNKNNAGGGGASGVAKVEKMLFGFQPMTVIGPAAATAAGFFQTAIAGALFTAVEASVFYTPHANAMRSIAEHIQAAHNVVVDEDPRDGRARAARPDVRGAQLVTKETSLPLARALFTGETTHTPGYLQTLTADADTDADDVDDDDDAHAHRIGRDLFGLGAVPVVRPARGPRGIDVAGAIVTREGAGTIVDPFDPSSWQRVCEDWTLAREEAAKTRGEADASMRDAHVVDDTQRHALHHIFTHQVAIVQGTPGTGKSFIGAKFIQLLLRNAEKLRMGPILVTAVTNHALDAVLEEVCHYLGTDRREGDVVRLGGRSKDEAMAELVMPNFRPSTAVIKLRENLEKSATQYGTEFDALCTLFPLFRTFLGSTVGRIVSAAFPKTTATLSAAGRNIRDVPVRDQLRNACSVSDKVMSDLEHQYRHAFPTAAEHQAATRASRNPPPSRETQVILDMMQQWSLTAQKEMDKLCRGISVDDAIACLDEMGANRPLLHCSAATVFPWWKDHALARKQCPQSLPFLWPSARGTALPGPLAKALRQAEAAAAARAVDGNATHRARGRRVHVNSDSGEEDDADDDDDSLERLQRLSAVANGGGSGANDDLVALTLDMTAQAFSDQSRLAHEGLVDAMKTALGPAGGAGGAGRTNTSAPAAAATPNVASVGLCTALSESQRRLVVDTARHEGLLALRTIVAQMENNPYVPRALEESARSLATAKSDYLHGAKVIGATLTGILSEAAALKKLQPRVLLVEEAAEALETQLIGALPFNLEHLVLIGDHKQLSPKVEENCLERKNFAVSLQERLIRCGAPYETLTTQRRMTPEVSRLIHAYYLRNEAPGDQPAQIIDHPSTRRIPAPQGVQDDARVLLITYDPERGAKRHRAEVFDEGASSYHNPYEVELVENMTLHLLRYNPTRTIIVLTAYSGQRTKLQARLRGVSTLIKVRAVDDFQGEEGDIVILSTVRTDTPGFLRQENRACVALSRARMALYMVGSAALLTEACQLYRDVVTQLKNGPPRPADHHVGGGADETSATTPPPPLPPPAGPRYVTAFPAECPAHHNRFTFCTAAEYTAGRCTAVCAMAMPCGHRCKLQCHGSDHTDVPCKDKCARTGANCVPPRPASCAHRCGKKCCDPCGVCEVVVNGTCVHCQSAYKTDCDALTRNGPPPCLTMITVPASQTACGHEITAPCRVVHMATTPDVPDGRQRALAPYCKGKCRQAMPCGHVCPLPCHAFRDVYHAHAQTQCKEGITVKQPGCQHNVVIACSASRQTQGSYPRCTCECGAVQPCGHGCSLKCGHTEPHASSRKHTEVCRRCNKEFVAKCKDYQGRGEISALCDAPCTSTLLCGCPCAGKCGECAYRGRHVPCKKHSALRLSGLPSTPATAGFLQTALMNVRMPMRSSLMPSALSSFLSSPSSPLASASASQTVGSGCPGTLSCGCPCPQPAAVFCSGPLTCSLHPYIFPNPCSASTANAGVNGAATTTTTTPATPGSPFPPQGKPTRTRPTAPAVPSSSSSSEVNDSDNDNDDDKHQSRHVAAPPTRTQRASVVTTTTATTATAVPAKMPPSQPLAPTPAPLATAPTHTGIFAERSKTVLPSFIWESDVSPQLRQLPLHLAPPALSASNQAEYLHLEFLELKSRLCHVLGLDDDVTMTCLQMNRANSWSTPLVLNDPAGPAEADEMVEEVMRALSAQPPDTEAALRLTERAYKHCPLSPLFTALALSWPTPSSAGAVLQKRTSDQNDALEALQTHVRAALCVSPADDATTAESAALRQPRPALLLSVVLLILSRLYTTEDADQFSAMRRAVPGNRWRATTSSTAVEAFRASCLCRARLHPTVQQLLLPGAAGVHGGEDTYTKPLLQSNLLPVPAVTDANNRPPPPVKPPSMWEGLLKEIDDDDAREAIKELDAMIGLRLVKEKLLSVFRSILDMQKLPAKKRVPMTQNFLLQGNPGCGKTTVAKLVGRILQGLDKERSGGPFEETTGDSLVRMGEDKASQLIDATDQGVLFIDEAYALDPAKGGAGASITNQLLVAAEDRRASLTIMLAGYKDDLDTRLLGTNPGFPSRFPHVLDFEDYDKDEIQAILESTVRAKHWRIDDDVLTVAAHRIARGRGRKGFGNARAVRNAFEAAVQRAMVRPDLDRKKLCLIMEDVLGPHPREARPQDLLDAIAELNALTGLEAIKNEVQKLMTLTDLNYDRQLRGEKPLDVPLNRLFLGNPGTGKTTVAKLYGRILKGLDLLSKGGWELRQPKDLIDSVVGGTEKKTSDLVNLCQGKVLIIDEAYALYSTGRGAVGGGSGGGSSSFGKAALDTLVSMVHGAPGEDIAVVLIGYEDEMKDMLNANPGLSRRYPMDTAFQFTDYTRAQLDGMLTSALEKQRVRLSRAERQVILDETDRQRKQPHFGNAGLIATLVAKGCANLLARDPNGNQLCLADFGLTNEAPDVPAALKPLDALYKVEHIKEALQDMARSALLAEDDGNAREQYVKNYLFLGSPGTGKTTVARQMGKVLQSLKLLRSAKVVEKAGQDLLGSFLGQTKDVINKIMEEAAGGVLFVDEAYAIGNSHYADEALAQLLYLMTTDQHKGQTVVILAGYKEDMDALLTQNAGLRSRFSESFTFLDWDPEDCVRFTKDTLLRESRLQVSPEAEAKLSTCFAWLRTRAGWGNGRDCTETVRLVRDAQGKRRMTQSAANPAAMRDRTVTVEDIAAVEALWRVKRPTPSASSVAPVAAKPQPPVQTRDAASVAPKFTAAEKVEEAVVEEERVAVDGGDDDEDPFFAALLEACKNAGYDESHEKRQELVVILEAARGGTRLPPQILDPVMASTGKSAELVMKKLKPQIPTVLTGMQNAIRVVEEMRAMEEEARRQKEQELAAKQVKLRGLCPVGYAWFPMGDGWRCGGGSHYVTNAQMDAM